MKRSPKYSSPAYAKLLETKGTGKSSPACAKLYFRKESMMATGQRHPTREVIQLLGSRNEHAVDHVTAHSYKLKALGNLSQNHLGWKRTCRTCRTQREHTLKLSHGQPAEAMPFVLHSPQTVWPSGVQLYGVYPMIRKKALLLQQHEVRSEHEGLPHPLKESAVSHADLCTVWVVETVYALLSENLHIPWSIGRATSSVGDFGNSPNPLHKFFCFLQRKMQM